MKAVVSKRRKEVIKPVKPEWDWQVENEKHRGREQQLGQLIYLLEETKVQRWLEQLTAICDRVDRIPPEQIYLMEEEWRWRKEEREYKEWVEAAEKYGNHRDQKYSHADSKPAEQRIYDETQGHEPEPERLQLAS